MKYYINYTGGRAPRPEINNILDNSLVDVNPEEEGDDNIEEEQYELNEYFNILNDINLDDNQNLEMFEELFDEMPSKLIEILLVGIFGNNMEIYTSKINTPNTNCNLENAKSCNSVFNHYHIYYLYEKYLLPEGQTMENLINNFLNNESSPKFSIDKILIYAIKRNQVEDYEIIQTWIDKDDYTDGYILSGASFRPPEGRTIETITDIDGETEEVEVYEPLSPEKTDDEINKLTSLLPEDDKEEVIRKLDLSRTYKNITIPTFVTEIRNFSHCYLEEVNFPEGSLLIKIFKESFHNCTNLKNINLENCKELEHIGTDAFSYCNLESVTIPNSVLTIKDDAFESLFDVEEGCNLNLQNVSLPRRFEQKTSEIFGERADVINFTFTN